MRRWHRWIALLCISAKTFPTRADDDDDVAHFIAQLRAEANAAYDGDADVSAAVGRAAFVESFVANGLEAAARELRERGVPCRASMNGHRDEPRVAAALRRLRPRARGRRRDGGGRRGARRGGDGGHGGALPPGRPDGGRAGAGASAGGPRPRSARARRAGHAYWEPHVDRDNVAAYAYSALVYLGDQGADFAGGTLEFLDGDGARAVRPRRGLLVAFSSGAENAHRVSRVTAGDRFSLAFWFAADGVT
ncbi:L-ascorbic acid binding protein [Aureococcus anophagefferens]|uniref:L-ascorbic acid binding protein n=1 Tax=Aureococcus anophagefferens TaxID=44056 RepID=A0ABR1G0S0_AURAN